MEGGRGVVLATHDCVVHFVLRGTLGAKSVMAVLPPASKVVFVNYTVFNVFISLFQLMHIIKLYHKCYLL